MSDSSPPQMCPPPAASSSTGSERGETVSFRFLTRVREAAPSAWEELKPGGVKSEAGDSDLRKKEKSKFAGLSCVCAAGKSECVLRNSCSCCGVSTQLATHRLQPPWPSPPARLRSSWPDWAGQRGTSGTAAGQMCSSGFNSLCTWALMSRWVGVWPRGGGTSVRNRKSRVLRFSEGHRRYHVAIGNVGEQLRDAAVLFFFLLVSDRCGCLRWALEWRKLHLWLQPDICCLACADVFIWQRCLVWICVLRKCKLSVVWGIIAVFVLFASVSNDGPPTPTPLLSLPSGWRLTCPTGWTTLAPTTKAGSITTMRTPPPAPVTTVPTGTEPMSTMTIIKLSLVQTWLAASLRFISNDCTFNSLSYISPPRFHTFCCNCLWFFC